MRILLHLLSKERGEQMNIFRKNSDIKDPVSLLIHIDSLSLLFFYCVKFYKGISEGTLRPFYDTAIKEEKE